MTSVGVVDYGMGNLKSILNALLHLGQSPEICVSADQIGKCERLVIPGVGAYRSAMNNLSFGELVGAIRSHAASGKPLLGICLGMQLLSTKGTEPEPTDGLNLIPGQVIPLPPSPTHRVPHVGWNHATLERPHPLFKGIKPSLDWYFVHSYRFVPCFSSDSLSSTEYGITFVSAVGRKNILGVQFHPEKSQEHGLRFLENFSLWDGQC